MYSIHRIAELNESLAWLMSAKENQLRQVGSRTPNITIANINSIGILDHTNIAATALGVGTVDVVSHVYARTHQVVRPFNTASLHPIAHELVFVCEQGVAHVSRPSCAAVKLNHG